MSSSQSSERDKDLTLATRLLRIVLDMLDDKQLEPWVLDDLQSALRAIEEANR